MKPHQLYRNRILQFVFGSIIAEFERQEGACIRRHDRSFHSSPESMKDEIMRFGLRKSLEHLRKYADRRPYAIPDIFSFNLGFASIEISSVSRDYDTILGHLAYWQDRIQWRKDHIQEFLTHWLHNSRTGTMMDILVDFSAHPFTWMDPSRAAVMSAYTGEQLFFATEEILDITFPHLPRPRPETPGPTEEQVEAKEETIRKLSLD